MGDMGDDFKALRVQSKARRADNRAIARDKLDNENITYLSKNDGAHFVIASRWDLWPGTGKWRDRKTNLYNHGLSKLISLIKKEK